MDPITSYPINSVVSTNTPVFVDNVQDLLNAGLVNVKPTGMIVVNSIADVLGQPGVTTLGDAIKKGKDNRNCIIFIAHPEYFIFGARNYIYSEKRWATIFINKNI